MMNNPGNREYDHAVRVTEKVTEYFARLLENALRSKNYRESANKSLEALLKHVKNGGNLNAKMIPSEQEAVFDNILKAKGVAFVKMPFTTNGGNTYSIYQYRDTDEKLVNEAVKEFTHEMGVGLGEVDTREFATNHAGQDIFTRGAFTEAEAELFRKEAAKENVGEYAFFPGEEKGTYTVAYTGKNREAVNRTLLRMNYTMRDDAGQEYLLNTERMKQQAKEFDAKIRPVGEEMLFVVDANNPNNFIAISNDGFSLHSITTKDVKTFNGTKTMPVDTNIITHTSYDRDKIMDYVMQMEKAVVLTKEEMGIVKNITPTGAAILPPMTVFEQKYKELAEMLAERTDVFEPKVAQVSTPKPSKIYSLENIEPELVEEIYALVSQHGLKECILDNGCLAYTEKEKDVVEMILEETLYVDLEGLELANARMYYEGRGFLDFQSEETNYLVDSKNPNMYIEITNDRLELFRNGQSVSKLTSESPNYEESIAGLIGQLTYPVVLTKEEFLSENLEEIVNCRIPEYKIAHDANPAIEYLKNMDAKNIEKLTSVMSMEDAKRLNPELREVYEKTFQMEEKTVHVNQTVQEQARDNTINQKLINQTYQDYTPDRR